MIQRILVSFLFVFAALTPALANKDFNYERKVVFRVTAKNVTSASSSLVLTVDGHSKTFTFSSSGWQGSSVSLKVNLPVNSTVSATVTSVSSNISDYRVHAKQDFDDDALDSLYVELGDGIQSAIENDSSFDVRTYLAGRKSLPPAGEMDYMRSFTLDDYTGSSSPQRPKQNLLISLGMKADGSAHGSIVLNAQHLGYKWGMTAVKFAHGSDVLDIHTVNAGEKHVLTESHFVKVKELANDEMEVVIHPPDGILVNNGSYTPQAAIRRYYFTDLSFGELTIERTDYGSPNETYTLEYEHDEVNVGGPPPDPYYPHYDGFENKITIKPWYKGSSSSRSIVSTSAYLKWYSNYSGYFWYQPIPNRYQQYFDGSTLVYMEDRDANSGRVLLGSTLSDWYYSRSSSGGVVQDFNKPSREMETVGTTSGYPKAARNEIKTIKNSFLNTHGETTTTYKTYKESADGLEAWPEEIETKKAGQVTFRVENAYTEFDFDPSGLDYPAVSYTSKTHTATGSVFETSTIKKFLKSISDPRFSGKTISVQNPDGSKKSYGYQAGTWNGSTWSAGSGPDLRVVELNGKSGSGVTSFDGIPVDGLDMEYNANHLPILISRSLATEKIYGVFGRLQRESLHACVNSGNTFSEIWTKIYEYDDYGNLLKIKDVNVDNNPPTVNQTLYEASYKNGKKEWEIDQYGEKIEFEYDSVTGWLSKSKKTLPHEALYSLFSDVVLATVYERDVMGRVVKETVGGTLKSERTYDIAGRLKSEKSPGDYETKYTYDVHSINGVDKVTTEYPDGSKRVVETYADGRVKTESGSAVPDVTYSYLYNSAEQLETRMDYDDTSQWSEETKDWIGRTVKTEATKWGSGTSTVDRVFDIYGRLLREISKTGSTKILPTKVYLYDSYGRLSYSGTDANGNDSLDYHLDVDVVQHYRHYQKGSASAPWLKYDTELSKPYNGSSSSKYDWQSFEEISGFVVSNPAAATEIGWSQIRDVDGNYIPTTTKLTKNHALVSVETNPPHSSVNAKSVSMSGLLIEEINLQGHSSEYEYDTVARLRRSEDSRNLATSYTYYKSGTATDTGTVNPKTITEPDGKVTTLGYDAAGVANHTFVSDGNTTANDNDVRMAYEFYQIGGEDLQAVYQWGEATNPSKTIYDDLGRQIEVHTYRGTTFDGLNGNPFHADGDRNDYMEVAGDKTTWSYDSASGLLNNTKDAANETTSYTYDAAFRVLNITDPRGVVTTHSYHGTSTTSTNKYPSALHQISYSVPTGVAATPTETYLYARHGGITKVTQGSDVWEYDYDDNESGETGTLNLLSETLPPTVYGSGKILNYAYQSTPVKERLESFNFVGDATYKSKYIYDTYGRVGTIEPSHYTNVQFVYDYAANSNLIEKVRRTISGANTYFMDPVYESDSYRREKVITDWTGLSGKRTEVRIGYDVQGRMIDHKYNGTIGVNTAGSSGKYESFSYDVRDQINLSYKKHLTSGWAGGTEVTSRRRDYNFDAMGNLTNRKEYTTNNSHTPDSLNQYDSASILGTPFTPTYDDAGNLTFDGSYFLKYDAKNQLVQMDDATSTRNIYFEYDYQGRRISKYDTSIGETRYAYQGWNLIAELNTSGTILKTYSWGLDASGSVQGAGGVGGLLMIWDLVLGSTYYPVYDGKHNIIGLHNSAGTVVAWYDYDPFGQLVSEGGVSNQEDVNPFRFSTKYTDFEIPGGLVYYGLRYYHSDMGRFINRDPIGIEGGLNLYGFVGNSPSNAYDLLGMMRREVAEVSKQNVEAADRNRERGNQTSRGEIIEHGDGSVTQFRNDGIKVHMDAGGNIHVNMPNDGGGYTGYTSGHVLDYGSDGFDQNGMYDDFFSSDLYGQEQGRGRFQSDNPLLAQSGDGLVQGAILTQNQKEARERDVSGLFDKSNGTMVIINEHTGNTHYLKAFSGDAAHDSIPNGTYSIVKDPKGRRGWFGLFKHDGNINDETFINGQKRNGFRLHQGRVSHGCVTCNLGQSEAYNKMAADIVNISDRNIITWNNNLRSSSYGKLVVQD